MKANPPEEIRGIQFETEFLKYYPVADRLLIDNQNRIYVRTYEKDDQGRFYHDVFDPEGLYISRFALPEMEQVDVVKDNKLYCVIRENEEGIPLVKKYSIAWK